MRVVDITKNKRIFPITVEPACLLKWSWSTIFFNSGTSASCHRTKKYAIDPNDFDNFHNLPEKVTARELMLDGQWPGAGCEYCRCVEESGGISDRQYQIGLQGDSHQHPPELNTDPTATAITPTILEVYFTNTCNMACIYCGPHFSSRWEDENRRFNSAFVSNYKFSMKNSQDNPYYDQMVSDLWRYLETNDRYKILRRYHVLGGEPFLLKELDDSIDFWESHPNIDLVFSIITNLNIPTERIKKYLDRFENLVIGGKIGQLQITASIDAWGQEQEYTRYGLDLNLWERNFELLLNKPWIQMSINSAISALTIKQMPALIEKINYWNSLRPRQTTTEDHVFGGPIQQSFNTTGSDDDPYIFGAGIFEEDFLKIISLLPTDTKSQQAVKEQMESINKSIASHKCNIDKVNSLKDYLDRLDHRRNTNWRKVFPWLDRSFD